MTDTFIPGVIPSNKKVAKERFMLNDGQVFSDYLFKNLWWSLNNINIGYGDLRQQDCERIQKLLQDDEIFRGWNEHQGTTNQQTTKPMVRITKAVIGFPHRNEDNYPDETQED